MNIYRFFVKFMLEDSPLADMVILRFIVEFLSVRIDKFFLDLLKDPIYKAILILMAILKLVMLLCLLIDSSLEKNIVKSNICGSSVIIRGSSTEDFHFGVLIEPGKVLVSRGALKKFEKDVITLIAENGQKIVYKESSYHPEGTNMGVVEFEAEIDCKYFNPKEDYLVDGDGKSVDFEQCSSEPLHFFANSEIVFQ